MAERTGGGGERAQEQQHARADTGTATDAVRAAPTSLLSLLPALQCEGLGTLCREEYQPAALTALAHEVAATEQNLSTGCFLVQAVALVRSWHLEHARLGHPLQQRKLVVAYGPSACGAARGTSGGDALGAMER